MSLQSATTFLSKHPLIWSSYQILQCEAVTTFLLRKDYHLAWGYMEVTNLHDLVALLLSLSMMPNVTSMLQWLQTLTVHWKTSQHLSWVDILTRDWLLFSHNIIEVEVSRLTKMIWWLQMMSNKAWEISKRNFGSTIIALKLYLRLSIGNVLISHLQTIQWLCKPSRKRNTHNGWNASSKSKIK